MTGNSEPAAALCHHCRDPLPAGEVYRSERGGEEYRFCCRGCQGAWLIITGAGLGDFYRQRSWVAGGGMSEVFELRYDDALLARHVRRGEEGDELAFLVEGIRCASCVWLIEKIVAGLPGVLRVRANYGSHRVLVCYDPDQLTPAALFTAVSRLGYRPRPLTRDNLHRAAERETRDLLLRFGTAFFLAMQLMGYSLALYAGYFQGISDFARDFMQYLAALVTTPVVFYSGWPFLVGAWRGLRSRLPNMDLLIALGVLTAYFYSLYATVVGREVYFETAAMIVTLILLGRLFENSARRKAAAGVDRLLHLTPDTAQRLEAGVAVTVDSQELKPGELMLVRPGERFAVDGIISSGESEVDESVVSGESRPVRRVVGEVVVGGSLNLQGALTVTVARSAGQSFVARMAHLVEEAQARKAPVQQLADRIATIFVPLVLGLSLATLTFWLWRGIGSGPALLNAIAVMVVACPCALGLATPTAVLVASGRAANRGILFRGGDVLEAAAKISHVAFDKTGTLTQGRPKVVAVRPVTQTAGGAEELLLRAALLESGSTHPLAQAIVEEARRRGLRPEPAAQVSVVAGRGMKAPAPEGSVLVGSRALLAAEGIPMAGPGPAAAATGELTEVHVAVAGRHLGVILLDDALRPDAVALVRELRARRLQLLILSGDHAGVVRRVAAALGIDRFHSAIDPAGKKAEIERLQGGGARVLMVGDGINDAPALATADLGCALAGGTDIAVGAADLVLTRNRLSDLAPALTIARRCLRVIRENLCWAFSYNLVTLPLAASGHLAPVYAAAAMAVSSILVVANSLRLSRGE
ncbi:heavy metal translocating P-type ATPase [Desulfurivibrio sp. D14AmB]|uniref:heavy metal translocating P-type ATPase n=1 Tax=Desulfurivibrio sp. D14AmB TaxID=3374370 RepID=UPI00376EC40E